MPRSPLPENSGRLLIVGAARSGIAAAALARRRLPALEIVLTDRKREMADEAAAAELGKLEASGVALELGRENKALLEGCSLVIKSPGVPVDAPLIAAAREAGIPVWGEVEFAWRFLDNRFIGVTGTNGKTTTTELIGHVLRRAGRACRVAGNVGTALSSLVDDVGAEELIVLELSSFQLEDTIDFRPEAAVLLNLSEDHLDRHPSAEQYFSSKLRIFGNQGPADLAVLNGDDRAVTSSATGGRAHRAWFSRLGTMAGGRAPQPDAAPLVFFQDGCIRADIGTIGALTPTLSLNLPLSVTKKSEAPAQNGRNDTGYGENARDIRDVIFWNEAGLKGEHNLENCLAATLVCLAAGLSREEVAAGLRTFAGVRHRLQEVAVVDGVLYVNDSKATNVDAALKALTAYPEAGRIHLILGGSLKGCSFDPLAEAAAGKVSEVLLIGEAAGPIAESFERAGQPVTQAGDLDRAIGEASARAQAGDVVLLAPACASFDQYDDYEQRGEHFIALVKKLQGLRAHGDGPGGD